MIATHPDERTRENMRADAPGEWKHKPLPVISDTERMLRSLERAERKAERAQHVARFKAEPSQKPASTGPKPQAPVLQGRDAIRSLVRQGIDKAPAEEVYGRTQEERAELPTKPVTPNTLFRSYDKRKKSALGLTTFGPKFKKPRKAKKSA